jgi:glutamate formiminotransferase
MQKRIVECVPNFSEGRDKAVIHEITSAIEAVEGVKLLDVDPGEATNRTVVTFVGEPEAVLEAAFAGVKRASELIDMRNHHGAHPRMGATDVLPLIPIAGITLEECAELSRGLARRIADELHIPTYCYEAAALKPERKNLAVCRAGEYEALPEKLAHAETAPDFGARPFDEGVARTGATTVGARDFLIAVNFNLNTTSTRRANAIAFDVREKGRPVREGGSPVGKPLKDEHGNTLMQPGTLKATKAIGWFIEEYGIAQVSMNITDISVTPLHIAFDEVCRKADARGVRVTGTEIDAYEEDGYAAEEYLEMPHGVMHGRVILHHDGQHHRQGGHPAVGGMPDDELHVGRGYQVESHDGRDEPEREVVNAPEAPAHEDVGHEVGHVGAVSAAGGVEVIGDVKQARHDKPRRIQAHEATLEEMAGRRVLGPREPQPHAAEQQEHVNAHVAAAHEAVHWIAPRHPHVEEHDEEHRQPHEFAAVAAYV